MSGACIDVDILKDIPGYRGILKAVLRYQIQLLVEQLCKHGGEESVLLSVNVSEGTLSHLGTEAGKGFLTDNNEVKRQYLGYCLKNYQKRKSEFMSPSSAHVQPTKYVSLKPESVVHYPVHKKPYFRVQRRNTRLRSGGKQFSSFYSKSGLNRPTLQKISTQGAYREIEDSVSQSQGQFSSEFIGQVESHRQHGTLSKEYTELKLNDKRGRPDFDVNTENSVAEARNSNEKNVNIQNESEVTVKVEPLEEVDKAGNNTSTETSEDIQTLGGGRLGHHFSPNVSMETEDSFSEGSQSFEYVLDQENTDNALSPWKPDEAEKLSPFTSKRKQALPTRIKKSSDQLNDRSDLINQLPQSKGSGWTHDQMPCLSGDEMITAGGSPYSEGAVDMNWAEESQHSVGSKTYMKTPQIVGLFVSRGEGRYEKLIKCEECGKVCRTSNMARHKKRYCSTLPSGGRTRKNYAQAIKELSSNSPKADVYLDNPEMEKYKVDLTGSSLGTSKTMLPSQTGPYDVRQSDSVEVDPDIHNENSMNTRSNNVITNDSSFDNDNNIVIKQEPSNSDII